MYVMKMDQNVQMWTMLVFIISCCYGQSTRSALFRKDKNSLAESALNSIKCAAKFMSRQYGAIKTNIDGSTCASLSYDWFLSKTYENNNNYYNKVKMITRMEPPIVDGFTDDMPWPFGAGKGIDVYFSPIKPWVQYVINLHDSTVPDRIILHFSMVWGASYVGISVRENGKWYSKVSTNTFPFVSENVYKITFLSTSTQIKVLVDDKPLMDYTPDYPTTNIRKLETRMGTSSSALFHKIVYYVQ